MVLPGRTQLTWLLVKVSLRCRFNTTDIPTEEKPICEDSEQLAL